MKRPRVEPGKRGRAAPREEKRNGALPLQQTEGTLAYRLCPVCGRAVPLDSSERYCINDGAWLLGGCPLCGTPIGSPYAHYCPHCGLALRTPT